MNRVRMALSATLLALLVHTVLAQAATDDIASQAVIRMSNAIGLTDVVESEDPAVLLAALTERNIITVSTEQAMTAALLGEPLTGDLLAIFMEDVLNGTAPAPESAVLARIALAARGLFLEAFLSDPVTIAELDAVFTSLDFAQQVAASYQAPASPISPAGN